jgi:hypothetical protein
MTHEMKVHHDSRPYEVALSEAGKAMREKLLRRIDEGQTRGRQAIERILTETPEDQVVPGQILEFQVDEKGFAVRYGDHQKRIHNNALSQLTQHAGIPRNYLNFLQEREGGWGNALAAKNLNELYAHDKQRHLFRSVGTQLRGVLSTKYQRRHPGEMLEAFMGACKKVNAVPYEATALDTRYMVKAVLARVLEPVKGEVIALGVVIHESPYGAGATEVSPFLERLWCTNKAVMTTELRKVHVGGRLGDEIEWSEETYQADTKAMCLQIQDLIAGQLGPGAIERIEKTVQDANEQKVKHTDIEAFLKKHLGKQDVEEVIGKYTSADIENLPAGGTIWRASNALSWFAGQQDDEEKKFEIQKLAGAVINDKIFRKKAA